MRRLCGDRTLAKCKASSCGNTFGRQISLTDLHSAALWQHLLLQTNSYCKPAPCGFFETKYRPYIFRRLATTGMSNATKCRAFAVFDKSASSIQNKIAHSTHGEGDPTLACKTTRGKHCYPVRRGASVCAPPLWHKKRTCNGCRFSFYKSILAGIFDSRLFHGVRFRVTREIGQNTTLRAKNTTLNH